jgi:ABC-type Fe3+ transport system permease subunit
MDRLEVKRIVRFATLGLLALGVVGIGGRVLLATRALADQPCNANDAFPGLLIVIVCFVCFGAGRLVANLRDDGQNSYLVGPGASLVQERRRRRRNTVVIQVILTLFLLGVVLALAYETVGLWNPWGLRPITSYVRCAKTVDPLTTTVVAAAASLLAGHWLWYPDRGRG